MCLLTRVYYFVAISPGLAQYKYGIGSRKKWWNALNSCGQGHLLSLTTDKDFSDLDSVLVSYPGE